MLTITDLAYVLNGTKISLMNTKNKQYVCLDSSVSYIKVNGVHPFLINKEYENELTTITTFQILLSSSPKPSSQKTILTYGNQISLMTKDNMFLVSTNSGDLRLEALKGDQTLTSFNLPINSKFTIIDPFNQSNISKPILFNDEVVLRSTFGSYLILNSLDFTAKSNGMIIAEETIWKMVKTNTPFIPDWVTKRKYLNYNNISYLFNLEKSFLIGPPNSLGNPGNQNIGILTNKNLKNQIAGTNSNTNTEYKDKLSLLTLSLENQEKCLIEDLLLNMIGLEGNYIKRSNKKSSYEKDNLNNSPVGSDNTNSNIYKNFQLRFEIEPYLENPTCDPSLLFMVEKILPLSNYYDTITSFINLHSHIETGLVAKAFCEGLRKVIREYILFVNQLEVEFTNGNLDIQKLWYLSQPSIKMLKNLQKLCVQSSLIKGGSFLNIIYNFLQNTTDAELKKMYKFLLDKSIEPYYDILKEWTCRGILNDEYEEFMVTSDKHFSKENIGVYYYDLFWDKKFILNSKNIPEFFQNISDKIFFIGKSLNILRECEKIIQCPFEDEFNQFKSNKNSDSEIENEAENKVKANVEKDNLLIPKKLPVLPNTITGSIFEVEVLILFQNLINKIFDWTNSTLKEVLFVEKNLESIFKSVKKFYFMECGDFYTHLIDLSDDMLLLEKNKINFEKLENLIENALRSTSANLDVNKEMFSFDLSNMIIRTEKLYLDRFNDILKSNDINDIIKQIVELNEDKTFFDYDDSKILESLLLEMKISWPLNLIFSKKSLIKYKILFRQLLILKYEEKKLSETWILQQNFKEFKLQNYLKPSYLLRDKMINFVKNIIYYFFNEVIEPNYLEFIGNLLNAKSIEEIIKFHDRYLDNCLKECLLDETEILIQINDILQACLVYSKIIIKFYSSAILDEKFMHYQSNLNEEVRTKPKNHFNLEKRKRKIEYQNKVLEEIFMGEDRKFLVTVEKFRNHFENKLEMFLDKISKM